MAKDDYLERIAFIFIVIVLMSLAYSVMMPDISKLKKENPKKTSLMEYRERERKEKGKRYRINQQWVPLSQVSPYLIKAVLIGEDDKFWRHEGFDYEAIEKAIEKDIKARRFKLGGSTVSQQLVKNLYLTPAKNPFRKIIEALITWRMEQVLSKKRILELYLNVVEWGDGIFGIEAASKKYYGKLSSELTPEEATRLAAVLPNPRRYNPLGNQRYVVYRSNLIYSIMVKRGIVIPEYREVTSENESLKEDETDSTPPISVESPNPLG